MAGRIERLVAGRTVSIGELELTEAAFRAADPRLTAPGY